jgi:hypothetical protein
MAPLAAQSLRHTGMPASPPTVSQRPLQQSDRELHGVFCAEHAPLADMGETHPSSGTTVASVAASE